MCIRDLFFKLLENKEGKKTKVTLSLILRLLRAPYMIMISGLEHLTSSEQPRVLGGLLGASEGRPRSNQKDVLTT